VRSLAWLAAPALLVAACTPRLDLANRPPPCASGFSLCAPTGVCVLPETLDEVCPYGLDVRQGGTVIAPVPGASAASDIMATSSWRDLETNVRATPDGSFFVEVLAPHGTRLGDTDPNGAPYSLRIAAKLDGVTTVRDIRLVVSPIAVSSAGDDLAAGTGVQPFRTLKQAAGVARLGDTISLPAHERRRVLRSEQLQRGHDPGRCHDRGPDPDSARQGPDDPGSGADGQRRRPAKADAAPLPRHAAGAGGRRHDLQRAAGTAPRHQGPRPGRRAPRGRRAGRYHRGGERDQRAPGRQRAAASCRAKTTCSTPC